MLSTSPVPPQSADHLDMTCRVCSSAVRLGDADASTAHVMMAPTFTHGLCGR